MSVWLKLQTDCAYMIIYIHTCVYSVCIIYTHVYTHECVYYICKRFLIRRLIMHTMHATKPGSERTYTHPLTQPPTHPLSLSLSLSHTHTHTHTHAHAHFLFLSLSLSLSLSYLYLFLAASRPLPPSPSPPHTQCVHSCPFEGETSCIHIKAWITYAYKCVNYIHT